MQAFSAIVQAEQICGDAISRVRVHVPPAYVGMLSTKAEAGSRQSTLVSVAHQIALCALEPMQLFDVDRSAAPIDPAIAQLSAKVEGRAGQGAGGRSIRCIGRRMSKPKPAAERFVTALIATAGDPENPAIRN